MEFFLDDDKKQRLEFCKKIIEKQIKGENIFFIDETMLESLFTYYYIWIIPEKQEKLRKGDSIIANIINRSERKFEKSIMIVISCLGLSNLMFLKGNMNDFQYSQALLNYKQDIDELNYHVIKIILDKWSNIHFISLFINMIYSSLKNNSKNKSKVSCLVFKYILFF